MTYFDVAPFLDYKINAYFIQSRNWSLWAKWSRSFFDVKRHLIQNGSGWEKTGLEELINIQTNGTTSLEGLEIIFRYDIICSHLIDSKEFYNETFANLYQRRCLIILRENRNTQNDHVSISATAIFSAFMEGAKWSELGIKLATDAFWFQTNEKILRTDENIFPEKR